MMPGRKLDALVAEKVMGCKVMGAKGDSKYLYCGCKDPRPSAHIDTDDLSGGELPSYSTDIAAAWEVVEKICPGEDEFRLVRFHRKQWQCTFLYFEGWRAKADAAPHAICLAALKACGVEIP